MHHTGLITGDNILKLAITLLISVALGACTSHGEPQSNESRLAWFHGSCLALNETSVKTDWNIFLIKESKEVIKATLGTKVEGDSCAPLLADRREVNEAEGYSFYQLVGSEAIADEEIGVALLTTEETLPEDLDTNNNKQADDFSYCTTSEGVVFYGWDAEKGELEPFWQEYYYMGYDVEPSCKF